ncbi:MAG: hypothetical protein ACOX3T_02590 [Bdellovibrionota bacterium]
MEDKKSFIYRMSSRGNPKETKDTIKSYIPLMHVKETELKQALDKMCKAWMPLNEAVYNSIKNNIITRVYDNNRGKFLEDISMDFTILALIFKEMPNFITSKDSIDPVKFLKNCDIEELKKIFLKDAKEYSYHSIEDMKDAKAVIYKHTAISTQVSQKFALLNNEDPLWVYVVSMLRGLANCLIAWNYPRLFSKALKAQSNAKAALDDFIEKALGFSPNDLIVELISSWNFENEIKDCVDIRKSDNSQNRVALKCIDDAEMIAKFYEPKIFPEVINHLDDFKDEISDTNISKVIKREVLKACEYYEKFAPEIFDLTMSIKDKVKDAILAHADNKLRKNTFIFQCDDDIINSFKKVYVNMSNDRFSKRALEILRYDTIYKAGFGNGCLYIYNEEKKSLVPTLKIGEKELYKYDEIFYEDNNLKGNNDKSSIALVANSLNSDSPIKYRGFSLTGGLANCICAPFGDEIKKGVLYLEYASRDDASMNDSISDSINSIDDSEMLIKFNAILRCLNECLGFRVN